VSTSMIDELSREHVTSSAPRISARILLRLLLLYREANILVSFTTGSVFHLGNLRNMLRNIYRQGYRSSEARADIGRRNLEHVQRVSTLHCSSRLPSSFCTHTRTPFISQSIQLQENQIFSSQHQIPCELELNHKGAFRYQAAHMASGIGALILTKR
jgi:hypothetical protein